MRRGREAARSGTGGPAADRWQAMIDALTRQYGAWRLRLRLAGVLKSEPLACQPGADTEIHTLLGHKGVCAYLVSVKSLLRFWANVAVVVHDDGTLSARDVALISRNVGEARILDRRTADKAMAARLVDYPHCARYRRTSVIALQLLDYWGLAKGRRIISVDSDILFLRKPEAIIGWADGNGTGALYGAEDSPHDPTDTFSRYHGFTDLNAGLLCFPRAAMSYEAVETFLHGESEFTWWTGQCCYGVLLARWGGQSLDPNLYQCIKKLRPGAVSRHYFASSGAMAAFAGGTA